MPTLGERLELLRADIAVRLTPEFSQAIERHFDELRSSRTSYGGLKPGATAPAFVLRNLSGVLVSSMDLLSRGPLVVSFFRGTWCPFCNEELLALNASHQTFRDLGAEVVAITPQSAAAAEPYAVEHSLTLPILVDHNAAIAEKFGLAYDFLTYLSDLYRNAFKDDLGTINAALTWGLPVPGRFVIDRSGTIIDAEVNADYRYRPDPEATLAIVAALESSTSSL
jgi:peroxiredoxin